MSTELIYSLQEEFEQKIDAAPVFWQHIMGLTQDSLIPELVQNELDANSSHTIINFTEERIICQGDGEPVDEKGWARLSFIIGAGDLVPPKQRLFGVKNHGLKACFTVGDEIIVRSDGKRIKQTLYMNGYNKPPSPGAFPKPVQDENAPPVGCCVEVLYRQKKLSVSIGEPFELTPTQEESIEELFIQACREAPQCFIGALRPDKRKNYKVELIHHRLGKVRFEYSCGRIRSFRGFKLYNRTCKIFNSSEIKDLPHEYHESCCLFAIPISHNANKEVPEFYSARKGFIFSEIAWKTNSRNKPIATRGHRRYPITYSSNEQSALTRVGVHFSGPYVSEYARRGVAENLDFNKKIDEVCRSQLITILRYGLIPRYGGKVLELLMDDLSNPDMGALKQLVEQVLSAGAFPIRSGQTNTRRSSKQGKLDKKRKSMRFGPKYTTEGKTRRLVIPTFTWETNRVSHLLAELCPADEDQIDPSVPGPIIELLADGKLGEDWEDYYIRFDEEDVIDRLQPYIETEWFPWPDENTWRVSLGNPAVACRYLDVVMAAYKSNPKFSGDYPVKVRDNAFLPDSKCSATPIKELFAGVNLPVGFPVRNMPRILHQHVAKHPIFNKKNWKRPRFTVTEFLDLAEIGGADEKSRKRLWRWLVNNWRSLRKQELARFIDLPIWPDMSGTLVTLSELCKPRRSKISNILKNVLHLPDSSVSKISIVKKAKRGRFYIRTKPTENEIEKYIDMSLTEFPRERALSGAEQGCFHEFEANLTELAQDLDICAHLKNLSTLAVALDGRGYVRPVEDLVKVSEVVKPLYLLEHDVIVRKSSALDRIDGWKPKEFPSTDQVLKALKQDTQRVKALLPRLQAYLRAEKLESKDPEEEDIADVKCILHNGNFYAPRELAFKGVHGDYWGSWKQYISGKGLSADVQKVYQAVGVLGSEPTPQTSLAFFEWLNHQRPQNMARHLPCIIRHINHRRGPSSWSEEKPDCPFIPIEADDSGVQLVSKTSAIASRSRVLIPDFEELKSAIRQTHGSRGIQLAIVSHPSVTKTITSFLHELGVKSLRNYAGDPIQVEGEKARSAPKILLEELDKLRTRRIAREIWKRLEKYGIVMREHMIRGQWRDRLSQIGNVCVANSVMAKFKIGRHHYTVPIEAAFDEKTGTIWLADSGTPLEDLFYQTIAERIFENPKKFLGPVLRAALRHEFREENIYSQGLYDTDEEGEDGGWDDGDREPGATDQTHEGVPPDSQKNLPKPGVIPIDIVGGIKAPSPQGGKREGGGGRGGRGRDLPKIEEEQKEDLKKNQYAWHCQICLAEKPIEKLAPRDSYVEIQENRGRMIRAHHADQVHAGGARHAGNMLILCNYHHQYIGDAISRQDVTNALEQTAIDREIIFRSFIQGKTVERKVDGQIITIQIPLTGEEFKCFFTESHTKYWLQKAYEAIRK